VVLELARIWPRAPIFTSLYRPRSTFPEFMACEIHTSPLDRLPVDSGFRALAPLYPAAFRSFGTLDHDLVLSSSSGWAHGVRTAPRSMHIVYCHTPARWLYHQHDYVPSPLARAALAPMIATLKRWDRRASRRADLYIANSENVRSQILASYGIEAEVVHPPVETERFVPRPRGDRLLVVSRLLPYKRLDLAVGAATRMGLPLDVVGTGPALAELRSIAGPSVTFHAKVDDHELVEMMESCRALVVPGTEDFGIVAVEAQAAGKPVVAFAAGGALETIEDGVTGVLFHEQSVPAVIDAVEGADALSTNPAAAAANAQRFSCRVFRERLVSVIARVQGDLDLRR
jgi:glycosyltransferase involved in cell wall biosynthesis